MTASVKASIARGQGSGFVTAEVDVAAPVGREVLVEVRASGLCHSDRHVERNGLGFPFPALFGHELAGVVADVGPDVTEVAVGDHVVGSLIQTCGRCRACRDGRGYQCAHPEATLARPDGAGPRLSLDGAPLVQGFGLGGFAEQALVHEAQLAVVPDEMPFPQAALLGCGVLTGAGAALNTAGVRPGDTVAVFGAGGVGLNVVSGARLAGAARIVVVDLQPEKLELARRFGATDVVDAGAGDTVAAVRAAVDGGVDHAFEVIGLKVTGQQAVEVTRVGGGTYFIGVGALGTTIEVDLLGQLLLGQKRLVGVNMGSSDLKRDIPFYADLYLQGRYELDALVSQEIALDDVETAYQQLESGKIARSVITSF